MTLGQRNPKNSFRLIIYERESMAVLPFLALAQASSRILHTFLPVTRSQQYVSAALGIGLASIFAELVSYRVVHDRAIPRREFLHHFKTHRAFLVAAAPSLIFIPAAALSIMTLRTALVIDIVLGVFSLFVILIRSAVTPKNTLVSITISIGIQAIIAALVVGLKLVK